MVPLTMLEIQDLIVKPLAFFLTGPFRLVHFFYRAKLEIIFFIKETWPK